MEQEQVGRSPLRGSDHSAEPEPVPVSAASAASTPNAGHTPGPWEACEPGDYGDFDGESRVVCSAGHLPIRIAVVHWNANPQWQPELDANARLIAAAPELLEALRQAEAAIARITEGDGGMVAETPWRTDGVASKNDRCPHGRWMYEGCETCASVVLDPVLDNVIHPAIARVTGAS